MSGALNLRGANDDQSAAALPSNLEAEQALLGCVLFDNDAAGLVDGLDAKHFIEPLHGRLWQAIMNASRRDRVVDAVLVAGAFEADPAFIELGGFRYIADLIDHAPPARSAPTYAELIRKLAARRELIGLSQEITAGARDLDADPDTVIAGAATALSEIEGGSVGGHWVSGADAVRSAIEHAGSRKGTIDFPFGIAAVDRFIGGMNAGEVTIVAARTGMGKTVAALSIAKANAAAGLGVCFFSKEMTRAALGMRLACDLAYDRAAPVFSGVPTSPTFDKAMKGELDGAQWRCLADAEEMLRSWPLKIDDRSGLTMQQIEAAARRQHREWRRQGIKPGPIVIDHLGKVRPPQDRRGSRHAEVADVSAETQVMAKRLGVPVLALVQLNRGVESRDDKKPMLADLRQAGELEEDARQVIFLYRPEYYVRDGGSEESFEDRAKRLEKLDACKNQMFWLVEKNSHGPRGQVQTFCEIGCSAIRDWQP